MDNILIDIQDFKGGMTLNEKLGKEDQFDRGYQVDFESKKGMLGVGNDWVPITFSSGNVTTYMQGMGYMTQDDNFYLGGDNAKLYYQNANTNFISSTNSNQTGAVRGLVEYNGYMYYPQNTTVGRKDLSLAVTNGYTHNWQVGLTSSDFHPMKVMGGKLFIGHGQYVAQWDNTTFYDGTSGTAGQGLDLADDWRVRCLDQFGYRYLAIGANYHQNASNKPTSAKIFLWDRSSSSWQDEIILPEPEIKAMKYTAGYLWIIAGMSCNLYVVPEGSRFATRIHSFIREVPSDDFEVYPNAITERDGWVYFALSGVGTESDDINPCAIYGFKADPNDFKMNIINQQSTVYDVVMKSLAFRRKGTASERDCIYSSVQQQNGTYNVYREETWDGEFPYSGSGVYESFRYSCPANRQMVIRGFIVEMEPMPAGTIVSLNYKKDESTSWTSVFSNFYSANAYEKINRKLFTANSLKLQVSIRGGTASSTRPFVKRIAVMGHLTTKP